MALTRVIMPKTGAEMEEGRIISWKKQEGERIEKGATLLEIETDKATMEVEAPATGLLLKRLYREGDVAPATQLIAILGEGDEPSEDLQRMLQTGAEAAPAVTRALPVSPAQPIQPAAAEGSGAPIKASPLARRLASEKGIDLAALQGTGPGGRIEKDDVLRAAAAAVAAPCTQTRLNSTAKLSPRERVRAALQHEQPDRTPCDFWAEPATLERLFAHVGHCDRDRLLAELEVDVRHLEANSTPEREIGAGVFQNFWGERFVKKPTPWGPIREDVKGALAEARRFSDLEAFAWPTPDCIDRSRLVEQCRRYENHALLYGFGDIWQRPALVRGWEEWFLDMVERPAWAHFLCRKFTDFYLEDYTRAAEITHGRIDLYLLISDVGCQQGPLISAPMFGAFVAPYLKEMADRIHQLGGRVLYHSCGAITPFIPEMIRLGVDVLDPIQPVNATMQPERLKAEFGQQLSFHGGIDMQDLLPHASPAQVTAEVRRYCEVLGAGGGYILGPSHFFQPDVPPENILAVYRAPR